MELLHQLNLCLPLVELTWNIFWGGITKIGNNQAGVYYQKIQHQIRISSVSCAEGGIKMLPFGMEKYIGRD